MYRNVNKNISEESPRLLNLCESEKADVSIVKDLISQGANVDEIDNLGYLGKITSLSLSCW